MEAAISSLLVGLVFVAALRCVGAAVEGRTDNAERVRGMLLVQHMLAELQTVAYQEPSWYLWWGPDWGESSTNRSTFDDLDDYDNYVESPPKNLLNQVPLNCSDWTRRIDVDWVNPADPSTQIGSGQGVKRATVQAIHNGVVVAQASILKGNN